ncbi:sensor domain-containing protein [Dactylosporangium siamense]|uniref:Putative sensor domain-containing protein n=1 Tax=Dactylosporangium siamense TaxID=685454 RepID=A0A919UCZ9_9ACTN|nr:sensor domain-containing protein [Dactylosporangium siamense]GIG47351.1 hypothetical protein Dsi01nite_053920 [Dactylosporangium siamense]
MTATLLETPRTTIAPATGPLSRVAADTRYVLTGFPLALAGLTLCMTGFVAGVSLVVVWVGVPLMIAAMTLSRAFAGMERARIAAVLSEAGPVRQPRYRGGLTDPQAWRDLAHASLRIVPSTAAFSVVVTWWAGVLGGLSWALWGWALPDGEGAQGLPELLGLGDAYLTAVAFYLVAALLFAVTLPVAVHGAARFEARFAQALLSPAALPEA